MPQPHDVDRVPAAPQLHTESPPSSAAPAAATSTPPAASSSAPVRSEKICRRCTCSNNVGCPILREAKDGKHDAPASSPDRCHPERSEGWEHDVPAPNSNRCHPERSDQRSRSRRTCFLPNYTREKVSSPRSRTERCGSPSTSHLPPAEKAALPEFPHKTQSAPSADLPRPRDEQCPPSPESPVLR